MSDRPDKPDQPGRRRGTGPRLARPGRRGPVSEIRKLVVKTPLDEVPSAKGTPAEPTPVAA